jgi:hypothetical protein
LLPKVAQMMETSWKIKIDISIIIFQERRNGLLTGQLEKKFAFHFDLEAHFFPRSHPPCVDFYFVVVVVASAVS